MALLWAARELQLDGYCVGEDHPDYSKELEIVDRLRAAAEGSEPFGEVMTECFDAWGPSWRLCIMM